MAEGNGTGRHPSPPLTAEEREVLRLLPACSPAFLGWLKLEHLGRVQREQHGVHGEGIIGTHAVHKVEG